MVDTSRKNCFSSYFASFKQWLSRSIFFSDFLEILPAGVLSLEILTNLSSSILVTCSSQSLLIFFHPVIICLDSAEFSDFLSSYLFFYIFFIPTIFLSNFISFDSNICPVFYVSALVSSACVIIGRRIALYIFYASFIIYLFLQTRSFKEPGTLSTFWTWFWIYITRFAELVLFTPKLLNYIAY